MHDNISAPIVHLVQAARSSPSSDWMWERKRERERKREEKERESLCVFFSKVSRHHITANQVIYKIYGTYRDMYGTHLDVFYGKVNIYVTPKSCCNFDGRADAEVWRVGYLRTHTPSPTHTYTHTYIHNNLKPVYTLLYIYIYRWMCVCVRVRIHAQHTHTHTHKIYA
jgi:hypothetical protein